MQNCIHKVEEIIIKNPIFNNVAECTYIVLCCGENPKRLPSVKENLSKLNPTTKVKLIFNKGYKNCPLSKSVNHDLVNIQTWIFNDAINNNYTRILYLEDDFELKNSLNKDDIVSIKSFIKNNNPDVYGLGNFSMPNISSLFNAHEKVLLNFLGLTHAVFYNKKAMQLLSKYYISTKNPVNLGIDTSIAEVKGIKVYRYYCPLIYQKLPATDNQKEGWKNQIGTILATISIGVVKLLKLDTRLEPGYTVLYTLPYLFYLILLILLFFLIKFLYKKIKK